AGANLPVRARRPRGGLRAARGRPPRGQGLRRIPLAPEAEPHPHQAAHAAARRRAGLIPMRVVFAGTPEFARAALEAIIGAGHEVPLVLTQPDRPSGRGMKLRPRPVKEAALAHGIRVVQPLSLRLDGRYPDDALRAL